MDFKLEGLSCPVCKAYLFGDDDIVFCPVCGAPHHRDCYNKIGHCALEELHGTDMQYDREKQIAEQSKFEHNEERKNFSASGNEETVCCGMCNTRYDFLLDACPNCSTPNLEKYGENFSGYDFLGGIPADYDIGGGITADEAKRFVSTNTPRYVKKFASLNKSNKVSWNWMAFLFPSVWLLSRKMYRGGIITTAILIVASLLSIPLNNALVTLAPIETVNYANSMQYLYDIIPQISVYIFIAAAVGAVINLAARIILGIFGDYFYKGYVIGSIKDIKKNSEDKDSDYRKKGGVSAIAMMIGLLALSYIPVILTSLI